MPPRLLLGTLPARLQTAWPHTQAVPADAALPQAAKPQFSVAPGSDSGTQTVTISDSTPGATIYYTANGTYPGTTDYYKYSGSPITVSSSEILVAVATAIGYSNSSWASAEYLITSVPSRFLYTIAGNDTWGYTGDGGPGPAAKLSGAGSVVADSSGNVYFADLDNNAVRRVDGKTGIITTIAGTGLPTDTGDGGPATSATLWWPQYLALDGSGNLYIAEEGDFVVRKLDLTSGTITRFAGDPNGAGTPGTPLGTGFNEGFIGLVASGGAVFIGTGSSIRMVDSNGKISEFAGYSTTTNYPYLMNFTMDGKWNIYGWESGFRVIAKITPGGQVSAYAGSNLAVYSPNGGDGGPATNAYLGYSGYLATDSKGNLYISDTWDAAVREVDAGTGIINTIAGVFFNGFPLGSDGDPATSSGLYPEYLSIDSGGNVYLSDATTARVRKITAPMTPPSSPAAAPVFSLSSGTYSEPGTLTITSSTPGAGIFVTFDGSDPTTNMQGYHGPITLTGSANIKAIAVAPGSLKSSISSAAYTITAPPSHIISTVAGTGTYGFTGAGGPAASALIGSPDAVAFDASGNLFFVDVSNSVVWKVNSSGIISIVAGTGTAGYSGDGAAAVNAELNYPVGVAVDKSGNLYIADSSNNRVRVVAAATGMISTFAGGGPQSTNYGDGGPATQAFLANPQALAFDSNGNLYIADTYHGRIREVAADTGIISSIAGSGGITLGDGGPATAAAIRPRSLALDNNNNIYLVDEYNARIRVIDAKTGIISTIAGGGNPGTDSDGSIATDIQIAPLGVAVDASGTVYYADNAARVRRVDASGVVTTVAGNSYYGYSGDGGEATMAQVAYPQQIAFDKTGSLYIPDSASLALRKVTFPAPAATPAFSVGGGTYNRVQQVTLTDSTSGATIYYTLDGTTPDTSSTTYTGPITISQSATLQSVAAANGFAISAVAKAVYTITLQTPAIALSSSAASAYAANPVTLTATLTAASGSPTGSVTFVDGTTSLGTGNVSGSTATFTTSSLAVGTHNITAVYSGDDGFNPITSTAVTVTISDFNFAPPSGGSTSATVKPGGTATFQLSVNPPSGSTTLTPITFLVSGLPAGATSSFNPSTVPTGSGATSVTLLVTLPAQSAAIPAAAPRFPLLLGLALLPLLGLGKAPRAGKTLLLVVLGIATAASLAGFNGCGGSGSNGGGGTPQPQTYNLTVTATAGSDTHTTDLTLTVQ
jgi:sugar lactone lactonase YvrE